MTGKRPWGEKIAGQRACVAAIPKVGAADPGGGEERERDDAKKARGANARVAWVTGGKKQTEEFPNAARLVVYLIIKQKNN